eukprot:NODE_66_length_25735_cov_0.318497.p14 type:complete len:300 gc:universal NODE_66_length_25735_cov_0.318497:5706-6605(+)
MTFTPAQMDILTIISKVVSILSFMGSATLIYKFYNLNESGKRSLYHRIILYISLVDIIGSINFFVGPWAFGNAAACQLQGFIVEMFIAIPLWNIAHATNVLVRVIYGWHAEKANGLEIYYHVFAWSIPTIGGIIGLARQVYEPVSSWCWYGPQSVDLRFATFYAWVFLSMIISVGVAISVTVHVKKLQENSSKSKAYLAGKRQILYSGAILITFGPSSLTRLVQAITGIQLFELTCFQVATLPLQGFVNCIINHIMDKTAKSARSRNKHSLLITRNSYLGSNLSTVSFVSNNSSFTETE